MFAHRVIRSTCPENNTSFHRAMQMIMALQA
jgi:hypothetical protein